MSSSNHTNRNSVLNTSSTRQVLTFTVTYVLLAALASVVKGNWEFLTYIIVMIIMIIGVAYLHARVVLSKSVLWCLSVWGLLHMMGGLVPVPDTWPIAGRHHVLYSLWLVPDFLKYDQVVHAYGFGIATWVSWQGLRSALGEKIYPTFGLLTLCVAAGSGFGALNEVIEFAATLILEDTNVGDYSNTGWDMVSNLIGAIVAAVIIRAGASRKATNFNK